MIRYGQVLELEASVRPKPLWPAWPSALRASGLDLPAGRGYGLTSHERKTGAPSPFTSDQPSTKTGQVHFSTISHWLGHASITTTNRYATVDLDMKREAIAKAKPIATSTRASTTWRKDASILEWLEAL